MMTAFPRLGLTALALTLPIPLAAQAPAPTPTPDQRLVGVWEGTYQSDHVPPGAVRLVVARDTTWRVTMQVLANEQLFTTEGRDVKLEGNILQWLHETMGQACHATAVLEGATLTGETSCGASGLSFTLTRLPPVDRGNHG